MDKRIAGVREDVGDRLELASRDRMDMEARLMAAIQGACPRVDWSRFPLSLAAD